MTLYIYAHYKQGGFPSKIEVQLIREAIPIYDFGTLVGFEIGKHEDVDNSGKRVLNTVIYRIPKDMEVIRYTVEMFNRNNPEEEE